MTYIVILIDIWKVELCDHQTVHILIILSCWMIEKSSGSI